MDDANQGMLISTTTNDIVCPEKRLAIKVQSNTGVQRSRSKEQRHSYASNIASTTFDVALHKDLVQVLGVHHKDLGLGLNHMEMAVLYTGQEDNQTEPVDKKHHNHTRRVAPGRPQHIWDLA